LITESLTYDKAPMEMIGNKCPVTSENFMILIDVVFGGTATQSITTAKSFVIA